MNMFEDKKAVYYTLGCKLNFAETSTVGAELKARGVRTARKGEIADICIVNTCSVNAVRPYIVLSGTIPVPLWW